MWWLQVKGKLCNGGFFKTTHLGGNLLLLNPLTRCMMPAAVSQTEMKMEMSWASLENGEIIPSDGRWKAHLMEVDVLRMLRY